MKKWNDREYNIAEWVITYISEMSVNESLRADIRKLKEKPFTEHGEYSDGEKEALIAAISYFEDFYTFSVKGYPKGSKTVKDVTQRLLYLKGAREKLENSLKEKARLL